MRVRGVAGARGSRAPAALHAQPDQPRPLPGRVLARGEQRAQRPDAGAVAHSELPQLRLERGDRGQARGREDAALELELSERRERREVELLRHGRGGVAAGGGGGAAPADGQAGDGPQRVRQGLRRPGNRGGDA